MVLYTEAQVRVWLDALRTQLTGGSVLLFKSPLVFNAETTLATFTAAEADFSNYARITLPAPTAVYHEGSGIYSFQTPTVQFNFITPVLPALPVVNTVYGWVLLDNAGIEVQYGQLPFATPMATDLDAIPLDFKFTLKAA